MLAGLSGLDVQITPANIGERVPTVAVAKFYPSFNFAPNIKMQIYRKRTEDIADTN
jgi:hypothetical protein